MNAGDMVFTFPALPAGVWEIRLVVDGAANLPTMIGGVYSGPTLTVP
jgi:hypothetical protein